MAEPEAPKQKSAKRPNWAPAEVKSPKQASAEVRMQQRPNWAPAEVKRPKQALAEVRLQQRPSWALAEVKRPKQALAEVRLQQASGPAVVPVCGLKTSHAMSSLGPGFSHSEISHEPKDPTPGSTKTIASQPTGPTLCWARQALKPWVLYDATAAKAVALVQQKKETRRTKQKHTNTQEAYTSNLQPSKRAIYIYM